MLQLLLLRYGFLQPLPVQLILILLLSLLLVLLDLSLKYLPIKLLLLQTKFPLLHLPHFVGRGSQGPKRRGCLPHILFELLLSLLLLLLHLIVKRLHLDLLQVGHCLLLLGHSLPFSLHHPVQIVEVVLTAGSLRR